jgi:hypothetical protein
MPSTSDWRQPYTLSTFDLVTESIPSAPSPGAPPWMGAKLERLHELPRRDPGQAKAEIGKHLDGELTVRPLPSTGRERRAGTRGRPKLYSLLEGQEAL